jgi:hypothetical protein
MNVPRLNRIPKNSASSGIVAVVAVVAGPSTVSQAGAVLSRHDHLPLAGRHGDEALLGHAAVVPHLVDERRPCGALLELEHVDRTPHRALDVGTRVVFTSR